jgi:polysaccharide export outer membrane protein
MMKPGNLLMVAFLAPALFCHAQDKPASGQSAAQNLAAPSAPASAKPVAQITAAPAAPELAKPAAPAAADNTYVIGAADVITVTVFKEPTLSGSLLVRPDGMISVPLLGDVKASGKTPLQLADEIAAALKKYVNDPNVSIVLSQSNSKIIYMLGEVSKPGPISMTPGMTVLQAIATTGGLTQFASTKKIYILRQQDGRQQKIPVRYKQALQGDAALNLPLNPGDTIVVP